MIDLAARFDCTLDWLLTGKGPSGRPDIDGPDVGALAVGPRSILLAGYAAADSSQGTRTSFLTAEDLGEVETVDLPEGTVAWKVYGDSMSPVVMDDQWVLTESIPYEPRQGDIVVAMVGSEPPEDPEHADPDIDPDNRRWFCKRVVGTSDGEIYLGSQNVMAGEAVLPFRRDACRFYQVIGTLWLGRGASPDLDE